MEDSFKIGQLTKELVSAALQNTANPCLVAAQTIRKTLQVTLKTIPLGDGAATIAIEEAIRGGLQSLLLRDLDVAKGGLLTLREMSHLADDMGLDPMATLMSAMRAMASLKRLTTPEQMDRMRHAIDAEFDGAGEAFMELLHQVPDPGRFPHRQNV